MDEVRFVQKKVDEDWKNAVRTEKDALTAQEKPAATAPVTHPLFAEFVSSLGMQALYALGEMDGAAQPGPEELRNARYLIDVLRGLQEKTKGNLSSEEEQLLKNLLYELQMKFSQRSTGRAV
ncbi:MAG: hypothetical protein MOGMAGMI_00990 [Candidatus Omnitrophica bacterium]|nr:hypothetical protein [Candidatus Omnitrophota bacterium]